MIFGFVAIAIVLVLIILARTSEQDRGFRVAVSADIVARAKLYTGALSTLSTPSALSGGAEAGSRKALLFGLNYVGTRYQLSGCANDIKNLAAYLSTKSFTIEAYTDDPRVSDIIGLRRGPENVPTRAVMGRAIREFCAGLKSGDIGFLWYSGHGAMASGQNVWIPSGFQVPGSGGYIFESSVVPVINAISPGARLFVGSDSCYSGSFMDLKYDMEPNGSTDALKARHMERLRRVRDVRDVPVSETADTTRLVPTDDPGPMPAELVRAVTAKVQNYALYDTRTAASSKNSAVAFVSGCRDNQTSADAWIAGPGGGQGSFQGAMTWAFLSALRTSVSDGKPMTIGLLQDLMRANLRSRYSQVPQTSFGSPISPWTPVAAFGLL